jgi:glycosyltransferase involved in cell wall biosynthesis
VAIVASHVIQYQDPFFRMLAAEPEIDLTVLYCSPHGARPYRDEDMKTTLQWDLELLQGYRHRFLRNFGGGVDSGYFRHVNPGIVSALAGGKWDAIIFFIGWGSFSALAGMAACAFFHVPFFLFGDSNLVPPETTARATLRAAFLRFLFSHARGFLTSGLQNADYLRHYGADPKTFFLLPWAIDNDRFIAQSRFAAGEREVMRARYGIREDQMAILFSGKLIPRKDPLALLQAFARMQHRGQAALVFMGDGELRASLEAYAAGQALQDVHFLGFINQTDIPKHYAMCDVFALPSWYEPRGTVTNEAMVCGLPLLISDVNGAVGDIVQPGRNAFVFPPGDVEAMTNALDALAGDPVLRARMSAESRALIEHWDYRRGVQGIKEALAWNASR